jgi:hypothetical protein
MSNPYAPGGQDPWNQGNDQGGYPGSPQPYGQADPNAYSQGGYVDQTQQMPAGYMDQYGAQAQYGAGMPGMQPEEPKSKLPLIIGGIAGVLVLILIGVGAYFFLSGDEEEDPDSDSTSTSATADPTTSAPNPKPTTSATSSVPTAAPNPGGYHANGQYSVDYSSGLHIEITKIEKGPADKEGSDTLVVTYSMTNNSSEEQSALLNTPSLKQKGIDMNPAYYAKGKEPAGYDNFAIVRVPVGQTKTFQRAYKMPYPNDPVTFKTLDWDDFNANIPDWTWQP